jgi:hypothetical protein
VVNRLLGGIHLDIFGQIAIIVQKRESFSMTVSLGSSARAGFFIFIKDNRDEDRASWFAGIRENDRF